RQRLAFDLAAAAGLSGYRREYGGAGGGHERRGAVVVFGRAGAGWQQRAGDRLRQYVTRAICSADPATGGHRQARAA
ncbi:hypothetical protein, partial [Escherichia coli]|uniref:hypothetical protein n=1 Tax=Escherichia coli TaxID=562 RepID=UPI003CE4FCAB